MDAQQALPTIAELQRGSASPGGQRVNRSTAVRRSLDASRCQVTSWRSRYCAIVQAEEIVLEIWDEKHVAVGRTLDSEH
jgi:hypothetical protein